MNTCIQCGEGLPEGATVCPCCGAAVLTIAPPLVLSARQIELGLADNLDIYPAAAR
ncbi:MAG: hypothetical protein RMM08_01610 [Armatimonadota bacterium]|nr:hypothetical protein [bacterium]MDW8320034.1 hypothetical protein [Armatimonadota bacterium]